MTVFALTGRRTTQLPKRASRSVAPYALLACTLPLFLSACAQVPTTTQNREAWTTHCFGRFQIAFPSQATAKGTYKIWGNAIERSSKSINALKQGFDQREHDLKAQQHNSKGLLFVDRITYENGSESIFSWDSPSSSIAMVRESYLVSSDGNVAYLYNGDVAPAKLPSSKNFVNELAQNVRSRRPDTTPNEPGFCIDGGYIAGNDYRSEGFEVGITLPAHPGAHITFYSSTGAENDTLLERTGGFLRTQVLGTAAGLHTLRKGKRNIGPIQGEEYLIASTAKGQRLYAFKWESQGKDNSLAEPNLSLDLEVIGQDNDESTSPKAFQSDDEALKLWDTILESIRLRPGAV